jgi:alpha-tubulin suppressor-like RCC1 family protein
VAFSLIYQGVNLSRKAIMQIYATTAMPVHWIVCDAEGKLWIVPAILNGWKQRRPYRGNYTLEKVNKPAWVARLYGIPA